MGAQKHLVYPAVCPSSHQSLHEKRKRKLALLARSQVEMRYDYCLHRKVVVGSGCIDLHACVRFQKNGRLTFRLPFQAKIAQCCCSFLIFIDLTVVSVHSRRWKQSKLAYGVTLACAASAATRALCSGRSGPAPVASVQHARRDGPARLHC